MHQRFAVAVVIALGLAGITGSVSAQPGIVGFSPARGGVTNIVSGTEFDLLRAAALQVHPGATFRDVDQLTSIDSATDDVVVISSGNASTSAITPLSAAEQSALLTFVLAGGSAIICVDNDTFSGAASDPANESLLDPFGFDTTGTGLPWARTATTVSPSSAVVTGPFATITAYNVGWSGWFNTVHPAATVLARLSDNNAPALAELPCNALGPGSGRVVLFADTTMLSDSFITTTNQNLLKNAFAYVTVACAPACDSIDFNNDTLTPDSGDLDDFLAVLAGGPAACSTFPTPGCNDLDFNNDGLFPDSLDLDAFINRLGGGPCVQ